MDDDGVDRSSHEPVLGLMCAGFVLEGLSLRVVHSASAAIGGELWPLRGGVQSPLEGFLVEEVAGCAAPRSD